MASSALADKAGRYGGPRTPTQSAFIQGVQSSLGERSRAVSEKEVSESQEEKEWGVLTVCWVQDPGSPMWKTGVGRMWKKYEGLPTKDPKKMIRKR